MNQIRKKRKDQERRRLRGRKKIAGTAERPRMAVFRSLRHIYVQLIDDDAGKTLVAASTEDSAFPKGQYGGNAAAAKVVGKMAAEKAKAAGISTVVFDRGGRQYHGRVKALAEAAREGGLKF